MSNLSDKELDRLSREAADSYEPDTSSLSWSRLEQKLTQQMPERPPDGFRFGRIKPYIWGPAVVLLAGVSFFFIKNINYSKDSTPKDQAVNQAATSSSVDDRQVKGNTIRLDSNASATAPAEPGKQGAGIQQSDNSNSGTDKSNLNSSAGGHVAPELADGATVSSGKGNSKSSIKNSTATSDGPSFGHHQKAIISGSALAAGSSSAGAGNAPAIGGVNQKHANTNEGSAVTGSDIATETANPANGQRKKNQHSLPAIVIGGKGLGTVSGNDSVLNQMAQSKEIVPNKSLHLNRSLNFGLSFGPDYTDGGGITNNQIGNTIGITVGYYLTSKLSVNTGIFYSNKFYWAHGQGYNHPQPVNAYASTFAAPPPVDYVNGSCNMWEVPLTLRYDFAHNEKTRFFADAGLSSYFMMKQSFIYFVHTSQRQLAAWKTSDNQQINYWFGVADISLGFETEVGKGVSFQAEPFVKLPLRSMGAENLRLTSYGFLLSFRYTPVLSRARK